MVNEQTSQTLTSQASKLKINKKFPVSKKIIASLKKKMKIFLKKCIVLGEKKYFLINKSPSTSFGTF